MGMLLSMIKKIFSNLWVLRSLTKTVYFNFHYLPFRQAMRLPILLYKPKFYALKGSIKIDADKVKTGMIRLGTFEVSIYPDTGVQIEIRGNVVFKGTCMIGNASSISIGEGGTVIVGDNFSATTSFKLVNYDKIFIGKNVLIGWNCMICDNDFHTVIDIKSNKRLTKKGNIRIGDKVWIANNCSIMKNAIIPSNIIVASHSLVNKEMNVPENSLIAGIPATIKRENLTWQDV